MKRNREHQDRLIERQVAMLNSIGMDWTIEDPWEEKFKELEKYKEEHGHVDVPGNYGPLGRWVAKLRERPPEGEKKERLDAIGFEWDGHASRSRNAWRTGVAHSLEYFAVHGDLKVPKGYVCADGYTLGNFIRRIRTEGKLDGLIQNLSAEG